MQIPTNHITHPTPITAGPAVKFSTCPPFVKPQSGMEDLCIQVLSDDELPEDTAQIQASFHFVGSPSLETNLYQNRRLTLKIRTAELT